MNDTIYRRLYKGSNESEYGEPSYIIVTEESNGHAVWNCSPEKGDVLVKYLTSCYSREFALELGVNEYFKLKGTKETAK